jgi:hypothetical protein
MRRERDRFRFTAFPLAQRPSQISCQGGFASPMLPGFRFLFSAIILSMSILVFGLGAAALLRAAHEEFASNPTWRAPPETIFAQQSEPSRPMLATLVVETLPAEVVAPKSEQVSPREAAKSEPTAETLASEPAPVQTNEVTVAPAAATETKIAVIEATPQPASEAAQVAPEHAADLDTITTNIPTLEEPPVAAEAPPTTNAVSTEPDKSAAKKRLRARRARERRRLAALHRAMLAKQAALQPATDLFGQIILPTQITQPIDPPKLR